MEKYIEVKNFGKIEHAKVAYNGYTVFMGDNNSGKTYLMQLIYAVEKNLKHFNYNGEFVGLIENKLLNTDSFALSSSDLEVMIEDVNIFLATNKENLVLDTFKKKINIDELKIQFALDDVLVEVQNKANDAASIEYANGTKYLGHKTFVKIKIRMGLEEGNFVILGKADSLDIAQIIITHVMGAYNPLYLPASRAGIQLLYKDYFTARADSQFYTSNEKEADIKLTGPMYEYLRFLQRVERNNVLEDYQIKLIEFIENNIIDGSIIIEDNNDVTYSQKNGVDRIPLYIVSSMISEVAPIVEMIQDRERHEHIFIDEVEASLHPKKQREMARLLNRIRNNGKSLLVSTHSDSMASYINNLLMASFRNMSDEELENIHLEKEDLLVKPEIHFYEFRNKADGKSTVEQLEVKPYPGTGAEFTMFNDNIDKLFQETSEILGV